eukprot:gnl/MRDRNA2_/MRDRNA2_88165_c0_seq1.p1 gnl/MRDRNA2_/MRDRNA2_88165_c0~~gnl/MRDRNA2_/MRDRNA2_88165_c0_seq1.p1  ORF type:complete len:161 (+),score=33.44 gnl/MRDRNA2_/MRDRNA2_88165_c0_seq1:92-574(+)
MADAFERNFFKPSDDGYTTSAVAMNVLMDAEHQEFKKKFAKAKARALRAEARPKTTKSGSSSILDDADVQSIVGEIRNVEDFSNAALGERTKREGKIDHVSTLFQSPNFTGPDRTSYNKLHCDSTITNSIGGVDKKFHFKKTFYSDYNEDVCKYKHTMRY